MSKKSISLGPARFAAVLQEPVAICHAGATARDRANLTIQSATFELERKKRIAGRRGSI
jgi:hypothetical protein